MDAESLLAQAPQYFENKGEINLYKPRKITDLNGFQYLVKGAPTVIKGAIHTERFLEENPFGSFGGASIILSTHKESEIVCGDLIEANGEFYAIAEQKPINDKTNEYDFVCYSIYDYYKDFLIDDEAQANRILGANSTRFFLDMNFDNIPIFPSMFSPKADKYLSLNIYSTQTRSTPYKNAQLVIEQQKKDFAELYAVGLDTNELQKVAYDLMFNSNGFALANFPSWEQINRYDLAFDFKPNVQRASLEINYTLTATQPQNADQLIKKVTWDFNFN